MRGIKMRDFYKIFYEFDDVQRQKLYQNRRSYESTVSLGMSIKPIRQNKIFDLYYIPTNSIIRRIGEIYQRVQQVNELVYELPTIARDQFIFEMLIEELYQSNEMEGVKSTKHEVIESVKEIMFSSKNKRKRFSSMIESYIGLLKNDFEIPTKPEDIRAIYDEITKGEIAETELPDGEIFRRDTTYILKKSGSGKVIHRGIVPEKAINDHIVKLLEFMNHSDDIPPLIKIAIGHFYFGYIHPFYDGNGRTSRFISSLYLARELGIYASLAFSQGCHRQMSEYLKSFEITNSLMNHGEMNYFIQTILDIMLATLESMLHDLKEKYEILMLVHKKIDHQLKQNYTKRQLNIIFILAQYDLFGPSDGMTIVELSEVMDVSAPTIRRAIKPLIDESLINTKGQRPIHYFLADEFYEN